MKKAISANRIRLTAPLLTLLMDQTHNTASIVVTGALYLARLNEMRTALVRPKHYLAVQICKWNYESSQSILTA